MYRGTTPTHTFTLPFNASEITTIYITYAQNGNTKIEKTLSDCTIAEKTISTTLTQAETLSLCSGKNTEIQLAVAINNKVLRSNIITVPTERILKDGEI